MSRITKSVVLIIVVASLAGATGAFACGGCAKTGSDKTSETKETTSAKPYACPMHPDVTSDKAGKCPKCGMNLVPQEEKGAGTAEGK